MFLFPEEPDTVPDIRQPQQHKKNMRGGGSGSAAIFPAKYKLKMICPTAGSWGSLSTSTPRKSDVSNKDKVGSNSLRKDQTEPMVAFSKPPPQTPFLGPLVAFSLFETWSHSEADEN